KAELPELNLTYGDFAEWHRRELEDSTALTDYWAEKVADVPSLELPMDYPRPPTMSYRAGTVPLQLETRLLERLGRLSESEGSTLFMVLLTAYSVLLYRYSGQRDFVVGTPVRNRDRETESIIGFFVNLVLVRARMEPKLSFSALLKRVQETAMEAFDHQDLPFELLLQKLRPERDASRPPLYQAFFSFQDGRERPTEFAGLSTSRVPLGYPTENHDVSMWMVQREDATSGALNYNADVFSPERMEQFALHYQRILEAVANAPGRALSEIELLDDADRTQRRAWNATEKPYDRDLPVSARIATVAQKFSDAPAVIDEEGELTYAELVEHSRRVAQVLVDRGVQPGDRVGVCIERTRYLPAAIACKTRIEGNIACARVEDTKKRRWK
ncbi:MAG: condensation domain-containing protein, partial [Myxococcota bacterium]